MSVDTVPSTLQPPQIAEALIQAAVAKHRTRPDIVFFKAVRGPNFSMCPP